MALPVSSQLCPSIDSGGFLGDNFDYEGDLAALGITMPGGAFLQALGAPPNEVPEKLLGAFAAALTPLQPIFDIVNFVFALVEFAKEVPNPIGMAKKLPELLAAADKLKKLIPQLAVPLMIIDVIEVCIAALSTLRAQLYALVLLKVDINRAVTRMNQIGAGSAAGVYMSSIIDCMNAQMEAQMEAFSSYGEPINRLLCLLNKLAGMVGLPVIPELGDLGADPEAAIAVLDAIISALRSLLTTIPRPVGGPSC